MPRIDFEAVYTRSKNAIYSSVTPNLGNFHSEYAKKKHYPLVATPSFNPVDPKTVDRKKCSNELKQKKSSFLSFHLKLILGLLFEVTFD